MGIFKSILELIIGLVSQKELEVKVEIPIDSIKEVTEKKEEEKNSDDRLKLTLTHKRFCADGIFGELTKANGEHICYTLEHSFDNKPKLVDGIYICERGPHRLHGMTEDFTTFVIKNVPNFEGKPVTGILFHWGNWNKDSEGCVLMGSTETPTMIGNSRQTFEGFMKWMDGVDKFKLEVKSSTQTS